MLKGSSKDADPQKLVRLLGSCRCKCMICLGFWLIPPFFAAPLFHFPLFRQRKAAIPAASWLAMWKAIEALGENLQLESQMAMVHLAWGNNLHCQWSCGNGDISGESPPEADWGWRKTNSSCFLYSLSVLYVLSTFLVCSNLHLPFRSCSPVEIWHHESCSTSLRGHLCLSDYYKHQLYTWVRHIHHLIF